MKAIHALKSHAPARILSLLVCALAVSLNVSAASLTWTGAVDNNWDATTLNWLNGSSSSAFHNGDFVAFSNSAAVFNLAINSSVSPGGVLVNASVNYSFGGIGSVGGIDGSTGISKLGTGTLTLASSNGYTGGTLIDGGTLALTGGGSISSSAIIAVAPGATLDAQGRSDGTLSLASGQTLMGAGSLLGVVTVAPGAVIAPGTNAIGTLTLNSNLTLSGNVVMKLNGSTFQNDLITGVNTLTYGGTLTVSNLGGALAAGESFTLFSCATAAGNFASIIGSPGPGLAYSFDPATGVLSVTNTASGISSSPNIWLNTVNDTTITVHFDDTLQSSSASNTNNYMVETKSLSGRTINVTNAVLQSDQQTVALYLDAPAGEFFALGVSNVLDSSSNNLVAVATGYTNYTTTSEIGTVGDPIFPGEVIPILDDTFTVAANGSDIGGTNDHCQLVYQSVSGNFEVAAQVTRLDDTASDAKAGLMAREDASPGSPSVGIYCTPLSTGGTSPTNQILTVYRSGTNGISIPLADPIFTSTLSWLRMTRTNNLFTVYYGSNGVAWTVAGSISQAFSSTLLVGLATTSNTNGLNTTAEYASFGIAGAHPGDSVVPALKASIFQGTNLVVNWQRTPHDFAIQICTNLLESTSTSSGSNSLPQWGFLMQAVMDTSLTGTNAAMPTAGRYMVIPMNLFPNSPMFVRLAQVDRVIPDLIVTPGYVFSLANSNLVKTSSNGQLCSDNIDPTSTITQNGAYIICPAGGVYQFTTANSGSLLRTALQVRNLNTLAIEGCDGSYSAGNYKAQVTFTNAALTTHTNFTFVAAATPTPQPATPTCPIVVTVNILH